MDEDSHWDEPTIDVIIPTIGRASLRRAVDSVLLQSRKRTRAIIVLDAPDRRAEIDALLPVDPRVWLVETPGGLGGAAARNAGLDASDAAIVAFLDDDDWWDETSLERRLRTVEGPLDNETFFVAGAFWHERAEGFAVVPREAPPFADAAKLAAYLVVRKDLRFGRTALQSSTIALSGDLARQVRWDPELPKHQDWDFALRALAVPGVRAAWLSEPSVHVEKDSLQSISRRLDWRDSLVFLDRHPELTGRARSDFLAVHVLRAAFRQGSREGRCAYRAARPGVPHFAALVVAASGLMNR